MKPDFRCQTRSLAMRTKIQYFARCLFFAEICEPNGAHCATQTLKKKKKNQKQYAFWFGFQICYQSFGVHSLNISREQQKQ